MKCKLIFYCTLFFYLELVASLPYGLNVPSYTQYDPRPSTQEYIAPQQYWNQRPYYKESYNYPNTQYQDSKIKTPQDSKIKTPQNYLYNDQQYVPDNQYYGSYQNTKKNPNLDISQWPLENKWQNTHGNKGESAYNLPAKPLTVTDKQYLNDGVVETKPVLNNLWESPVLRGQIEPKKVLKDKKEPLTVSKLELFKPPIPAIPIKPVHYTEDKYIVKNKLLSVELPKEITEERKIQNNIYPTLEERYFATSTNLIETIVTPDPVPIKAQIQQMISNFKIRDMITSRKSTSRYLVVYPNGTISRVNTLKSVAEQHPNYVLVHAGDLLANSKEHKIQVSTSRPPVTNKENITRKPSRLSQLIDLPLNALNSNNTDVKTSSPNTSLSAVMLPTRPSVVEVSNKSVAVDSLPIQVNLSPDMTSPIEIPAKSVVKLLLPAKPSPPTLSNDPVTDESLPKTRDSLKVKETLNAKAITEPVASNNSTTELLLKPAEQPSLPITSIKRSIPINISSEAIPLSVETLSTTTNTSDIYIQSPKDVLNITKIEVLPEKATPVVADADILKEVPVKLITEEILLPISSPISSNNGKVAELLPINSEPPSTLSPAIEIKPEGVSLNIVTTNLTSSVDVTPSTTDKKLIVSQPNAVAAISKISTENQLELPKEIIAQSSPTTNETLPAVNSSGIIVTTNNEDPSSETTITTATVTPVTNKTNEQSAAPTTVSENIAQTPVPNETSVTTAAIPSLIEPILLNVAEGSNIPYLPGNIDISKVKTNESPTVWFKTTEETFWNKLANGANDFDIVYFFNINSPPRIENNISKTVYPNGTIVEEITKTVWDPDTDKSTVTKTTRVIPPDG